MVPFTSTPGSSDRSGSALWNSSGTELRRKTDMAETPALDVHNRLEGLQHTH